MLTRAKSSTFYVNFAAFCVFIDVFLTDIIYVFCNHCNCKNWNNWNIMPQKEYYL